MASPATNSTTTFLRPFFQLLPIPSDAELSPIRSLPELVLFNALHNPRHAFCHQSSQAAAGQIDSVPITFHQLAVAVENCCSWLLETIPNAHPAKLNGDHHVRKAASVALFLESDVGLFIHVLALLTLNIPCVLLSIRLGSNAVRKLLHETGASAIIISSRTAAHIEDALQATADQLKTITYQAAPFTHFLPSSVSQTDFPHLQQCRRHIREDDMNVIILHSSGTTGLPKAIPLAHRYLLGYAGCHELPDSQDESRTGVNLSTLPLFHGFGVLAPALALSVGKTVCFPPSDVIGNGSFVLKMLRSQNVTSLMTVPTILEEITQASAAKQLASLDFVVVGGGSTKPAVANDLHENGVSLLNHFGATELGALAPIFRPEKSYDWRYLRLRNDLGLQLKQTKLEDAKLEYKLSARPFGSTKDFELQDSLEVNPLSPSREVKLMGRKDDLLVLATGEKVSPQVMEEALAQDSRIKRAVVFGNGQFEVGVLVEAAQAVDCNEADFVDSIWPSILEANSKVDQHAVISTKAAVLVKPHDKNIPLSDKGSPQRKDVYSVFKSEIETLYDLIEQSTLPVVATELDKHDLRGSLRNIVQSCLPKFIKTETWNDDDDFVQLGMDSLQATRLRRILSQSVQRSSFATAYPEGLPADFVYTHPSIAQLITGIHNPGSADSSVSSTTKLMRKFTEMYSFTSNGSPRQGHHTVLLTGATGNLGSHLLPILCELTHVSHVISLVRIRSETPVGNTASAAVSTQKAALEARSINLSKKAWSKVKVLAWQPGKNYLGLKDDEYHQIASTVTHIFHGAWPMDFRMKLSSFENQIKALHDLIELGCLAHRLTPTSRPRLILASSIAVVGNCSDDQKVEGMVPELPLHDPERGPLAMGYAEAKWVCEQVVESAYNSLQSEMEPMIVRIGQLSGSQTSGYWSTKEHFAALVKASKTIGYLPDLRGTLSWLPVDKAARTVVDLLLGRGLPSLVAHVENPVRQSWADVCSILEYILGMPAGTRLPYSIWLERVSKLDDSPSELMEFFNHEFLRMSGGDIVLDTKQCRVRSPTLKSTGAVGPEEIGSYISFWRRFGYLRD
ncbi:MAG: hypothetical protein Q9169_005514 [Polycauliona sp. 2 TL-2023]